MLHVAKMAGLAAVPTGPCMDEQMMLLSQGSLDPIVAWLAANRDRFPLVDVLLVLMVIDVIVGFCAAFITKTISSTICSRGMMKKVIIIMLVGMCAAIEPYTSGIPLSKLAAMAFIVFECTSIVENAARAGVPIPSQITDSLALLKGADKQKASVTNPPAPAQSVTINRATSVDIHSDSTGEKKKSDSVVVKTTDMPVNP